MGEPRQFPPLWSESSRAELFTCARVAKPANERSEPTGLILPATLVRRCAGGSSAFR